jgi:hypothetical protein
MAAGQPQDGNSACNQTVTQRQGTASARRAQIVCARSCLLADADALTSAQRPSWRALRRDLRLRDGRGWLPIQSDGDIVT